MPAVSTSSNAAASVKPRCYALYAITDPAYSSEAVDAAIAGGVTVLQVRNKPASDEAVAREALELRQRHPGLPIFINDRLEVAARHGFHLHVGQHDISYLNARRQLPAHLAIGLTIETYEQLEACIAACQSHQVALPDVVGIGPLHSTATKPDAPEPLGLEVTASIAALAREHDIASVVIGGVTLDDAPALAAIRTDGMCAISALLGARDPEAMARAMLRAFRTRPRVLSIAGTDPTGGAGSQADVKAISAAGGYALAVTTAIVSQNTLGVTDVFTPPKQVLEHQLCAVEDVSIDAVKIGMLGDTQTIATVKAWLERTHPPIVVIDPVMVSTSGHRLLDRKAERDLHGLLPLATVITPNIPELAVCANADLATTIDEAIDQAAHLQRSHEVAVLVKGGHLAGTPENALVTGDGVVRIPNTRVHTGHTHGTGCSMSSALATRMVDDDMLTAARWTTQWLHTALEGADFLRIGHGNGPVDHFASVYRP